MKLLVLTLLALVAGSTALYSGRSDVTVLTSANFDREVLQSDEPWLIEFYAPWCGHCRALTPHWEKAATELLGTVRVGAVDADSDRDLGGKYNIQGFPTIKFFGENKDAPEDYQGGRTADDIVAFGRQHGGGVGMLVEVTKATAAGFVNFDSPLKLLYFQSGRRAAPMYVKKLSTMYRMGRSAKVLVGYVNDSEEEVVSKFEGVSAPALIAFNKDGFVQYHGESTSAALKEFVEEMLAGNNEDHRTPMPKFSSGSAAPEAEIAHLADADALKATCVDSGNICVVGLLPEKDENVAMLSKLAGKLSKSPLSFAWAEVGAASKLAAALSVSAEDAPTAVLLRLGKRNRFAKLEVPLTSENLQAVIDRALGGDLRYTPLKTDVASLF